ncbi:chemotaxis protein CheB [Caballeronia sp. dw_276]|uniref:chemotaxis protein CheB n=1 Tax=Caballeronia sp. dw_276 TaxID=2719795 RepID=UPI001BD2857C|nr:chemotaxis protein CheB [Caballeronia sp. dw_276]
METNNLPYVVAIGASGSEGLNDIVDLLGAWPDNLQAIVMVVLHRSSDAVSHLQEILSRGAALPVIVAVNGQLLLQDVCYIGEPDQALTLSADGRALLVEGIDNRLRNRTVDTLFESIALHAGRRSVGIVLSGALDDGSRGLAAIHAVGGLTMVLDPAHKPIGMQQNAIDFDGSIDFIGNGLAIAAALEHAIARIGSRPQIADVSANGIAREINAKVM